MRLRDRLIERYWHNPLLVRHVRRQGRLSVWTAFLLGFGVSLLGAALTVALLLYGSAIVSRPLEVVLTISVSVILFVPVFIAYRSANTTAYDLQNPQYDLMCLTTIPDSRMMEGLVLSALYRCGYLLLALIGAMPILTVGMIYNQLYVRCPWTWTGCLLLTPSFLEVVRWLPSYLLLGLSVLGVNFAGAAVGVAVALSVRNVVLSGVVALLATLFLVAIWLTPWDVTVPPLLQIAIMEDMLRKQYFCAPAIYGIGITIVASVRSFARSTTYHDGKPT